MAGLLCGIVLLLEQCYDKPRTKRRASKKPKATLMVKQMQVDSSQLGRYFVCSFCNQRKGSDLSSIDPETAQIVPLFHPRRDRWPDHFRISGGSIEPLTP